jgi:hypothetical protein
MCSGRPVEDLRMVDPDRERREELEEIDVGAAVRLVAQPHTLALLEVDDDGKPVDQHVTADGFEDLFRLDVDISAVPGCARHGWLLTGNVCR